MIELLLLLLYVVIICYYIVIMLLYSFPIKINYKLCTHRDLCSAKMQYLILLNEIFLFGRNEKLQSNIKGLFLRRRKIHFIKLVNYKFSRSTSTSGGFKMNK